MPICGNEDSDMSYNRKNGKFKKGNEKDRFLDARNNMKMMLEEEAFIRYKEIRVSPKISLTRLVRITHR